MSKQIAADVLSVLRGIEFDGEIARITHGQLDRALYQGVNKVLESLGGKWSRGKKGHVFASDDARDSLEAVIESGQYIDPKQFFGFFETPDSLADEVIERACIDLADHFVLEPSAGTGQLLKAIQRQNDKMPLATVRAVEIQERRRAALAKFDCQVVIGDFLAEEPAASFDRVVMNPPFARQSDIDHVRHAWKFLKPGGRLVSIMSTSWTFRDNTKSRDFRAMVDRYGESEANPPGSFKAAGTSIETTLVVLRKE